jgi:cell wall-associated NlpC family hydrolase
MRFKLLARAGGVTRATPGAELRRGRGSGGLADAVHRISIRRDDSYLGWLTELYGQPYIWASAGASDRTHQTERLEGSDCADFVSYGRRRLGYPVPYTWTEGLRRYTRRLSAGHARADGVYVDERGRPLPFPRPGDLVLFPRHVGALVEDRGGTGVLDQADVMAHALFASPHEEAIGASGYGDKPLEVMRWK